jgi:thiol-disulfide isomerase/thioredoxin
MKRLFALFLALGMALAAEYAQPAPDFSMFSPTIGQVVQLSQLKGKPVVVNFWGSWCPPCREEMPAMNAVSERLKEKFTFLAVAYGESPVTSEKYIKDNNYAALVLLTDSQDAKLDTSRMVVDRYKVSGYPTTFFVDKDGVIQAVRVGSMSERAFLSYLRNIDVNP